LHFNPKFRVKGHGLRLTESVPLRVLRELFRGGGGGPAAASDRDRGGVRP
jgi:hypothetical protein